MSAVVHLIAGRGRVACGLSLAGRGRRERPLRVTASTERATCERCRGGDGAAAGVAPGGPSPSSPVQDRLRKSGGGPPDGPWWTD